MPESRQHRKKKEELREHILEVAKNIAAKEGWQHLTIRKICDQIHYTAPVVYQYFESKETILVALRLEGLKQIYQVFTEINIKHKTPNKRLLEYGLAWWHFANQQPELYQVMFNLQGVVCVKNQENCQNSVVGFYFVAFSEMSLKAKRSEKLRLELCDNLIAIIHGFISMNMANKIKSGNDRALLIYKNSLQRFIHSINDINTKK